MLKKFLVFFILIIFFTILNRHSAANQNQITPSFSISFTGDEEVVFPPGQWGFNWIPDETISFINDHGNVRLWVADRRESYLLRGSDFDHLKPDQLDGSDNAVPILEPSGVGFDKDYAGVSSVIRANNGSDLLMIYHAEDYTCKMDKAHISIGLARSSDNGITWARMGQIITGRDTTDRCTKFNGAGNPSVVISLDGDYFYLYYVDWDSEYNLGADGVHLARALRSSDGAPGSWFKYNEGQFSEPGLGGFSSPVIKRASKSAAFAGSPNVSFNSFLNKYLAIVTGHDGFSYTSSPDGINWDTPRLFMPFPIRTDEIKPGDTWFAYPTLLDLEQKTQLTTHQSGYMYYAHGTWQGNHHMVRRPYMIGSAVYLPLVKNIKPDYQHTPTPTISATAVQSPTPSATFTPSPTPKVTPTPSPTLTPSPTPTATPTIPPGVSIPENGTFAPPPGWTWFCSGDFTITRPDGETVMLGDELDETGLIIQLFPDSQVIVNARWGGYCQTFYPNDLNAGLQSAINSMLDNGCSKNKGCSSINIKKIAPNGDIMDDYWVP